MAQLDRADMTLVARRPALGRAECAACLPLER
jgi:hypothetical protein